MILYTNNVEYPMIQGNVDEIVEFLNRSFIDISTIPTFLGDNLEDRIKRYLSLKSKGLKLIEI